MDIPTIIDQWEAMQKMRLFEIELNNGEYELIEIELVEKLTLNQCYFSATSENCNCTVVIDDTFSLDEHLQYLYDKCINQLIKKGVF